MGSKNYKRTDIKEMTLNDKFTKWIREGKADDLIFEAKAIVDNLSGRLFADYEPTRGPHLDFQDRLESWLEKNKLSDKNQRVLFSLIRYLFFIGVKEFDTLFQVAFNEYFITWLIDELDIKLDDAEIVQKLKVGIKETWFCPISDSLKISMFYHINRISGQKYRPDWASLEKFGDKKSISKHIKTEKIKRIVLLEDFVGSGTQMKPIVEFAALLDTSVPVLIIPFIICPEGLQVTVELMKKYKNLKVSPIINLSKEMFLKEKAVKNEAKSFGRLRKLVKGLDGQIFREQGSRLLGESSFGFMKTGAFVVTYANCPNNSLAVIHKNTADWYALFPRAVRH
jgi:hypothetical protein